MLVVMQSHATEEQVRAVCQRIESLGFKAHPIPGAGRTAIGLCRCGHSKNKPFCDGSHNAAAFTDNVVARELPPPKPKI